MKEIFIPQFVPIVLTDEKATPVDHTFKPRTIESGIATFVESTGTPLGESRITMSQNRNANGRIRAVLKLTVPVVQDATVNGVTKPTVVRTSYADITFNFDPSSSVQERKDLVKFVNELTLSSETMMQAYLVDLEGLY